VTLGGVNPTAYCTCGRKGDYSGQMPLKCLLDLPDDDDTDDEPLIEGEDDDDDKALVGASEAGRAGPGAGGQRPNTHGRGCLCRNRN
jgi:hypothetical protein